MDSKSEINQKDKDGRTPLHRACLNGGRLEEIRALIAQGADVNSRDDAGKTPLFLVKSENVLTLLLESGASINIEAKNKDTPLVFFLTDPFLKYDLAETLIARGADVNARGFGGFTALHHAAMNTQSKLKNGTPESMAELLINRGAKVNAVTDDEINNNFSNVQGATPLFLAARSGNEGVLKQLIAHGATLNTRTTKGESPVMIAIQEHHMREAKALIDGGALLNEQDVRRTWEEDSKFVTGRNTLLHNIAASRDESAMQIARLLVSLGADVNARDDHGRTPLMNAILFEVPCRLVEFLLEKGADINLADRFGETALTIAGGRGRWVGNLIRAKKPTERVRHWWMFWR